MRQIFKVFQPAFCLELAVSCGSDPLMRLDIREAGGLLFRAEWLGHLWLRSAGSL